MIFDDEFFDNIPEKYLEALSYFTKTFYGFDNTLVTGENEMDYYEDYIDAYFAFEAFINSRGLKNDFNFIELDKQDRYYNLNVVHELYKSIAVTASVLNNNDIIEASHFRYSSKANSIFCYKFTDGDLQKIQELINELRSQISESDVFSQNHRERLLRRLEGLQKELHKRMSNLDKFWGLIGDAGVVMGKFGNDVKPIVDRIKEITEIVWRTQAMAEELPSGTSSPMIS